MLGTQELISFHNVSKSYPRNETPAVSVLNFSMKEGEVLALLGPSGSGKTTTLRLIAGFEKPDIGCITLKGEVVSGDGFWVEPEHRRVGMVFQDYALFPHMTLAENIMFGIRKGRKLQRSVVAKEMLNIVGMDGMADRYPHELSGGQQQRVAIARALAPKPSVLLLDEPFSNLDADMRAEMREEVNKILRPSNTSAIVVTHDQDEAFALADRVGVINRGILEQISSPEELYRCPRTRFISGFVGQANFIPGVIKDEIQSEIGIFPNKLGLAVGTRVDLMIRPENVELVPIKDGQAVVTERNFRGPHTIYTVVLESGTVIRSSRPSTDNLKVQDRVNAYVRGEGAVVFTNS